MKFSLCAGDIFLSKNPMIFGKAICFMERLWSKDQHAFYGHAGIITSTRGRILESSWKVHIGNLKHYEGDKIIIARYKFLKTDKFKFALEKIARNHLGQIYPVHRLFLHAFNVAHFFHWKRCTCAELTVKFLHLLCRDENLYEFEHWYGWTPDDLHDVFRRWTGHFDIIFEGEWNSSYLKF